MVRASLIDWYGVEWEGTATTKLQSSLRDPMPPQAAVALLGIEDDADNKKSISGIVVANVRAA